MLHSPPCNSKLPMSFLVLRGVSCQDKVLCLRASEQLRERFITLKPTAFLIYPFFSHSCVFHTPIKIMFFLCCALCGSLPFFCYTCLSLNGFECVNCDVRTQYNLVHAACHPVSCPICHAIANHLVSAEAHSVAFESSAAPSLSRKQQRPVAAADTLHRGRRR